MASKSVKPMSEAELLRFRALLGEPPVLSSEDREHFEELFRSIAAAMKPRNMLDVLNLWHCVCASWFINRYNRHATVAIERHTLQMQANEAERARLRKLRASNQEHIEARKLTGSPADVADTVRLHENFEDRIGDADRIFEHSDLERNHNRSLLAMLDSEEKLSRLAITQTAIKNESYRQFELCQMGFGELAGEDTQNFIEGECKAITGPPHEAEASSIVPADDAGSHDVEQQNRSEPAE
jgi:hypothetical protein